MKTHFKFLLFFILLSFRASNASFAQSFAEWKSVVGFWEFQTAEGVFSEEWKVLNDSTYTGIGMFKSAGGDTLFTEELKVIQKDGKAYYVAKIENENDGQEVLFQLQDTEANQWYFANPMHDFPKIINYNLKSPEYLYVWIEGKIGGNTTRKYFHFSRRAITKMDNGN